MSTNLDRHFGWPIKLCRQPDDWYRYGYEDNPDQKVCYDFFFEQWSPVLSFHYERRFRNDYTFEPVNSNAISVDFNGKWYFLNGRIIKFPHRVFSIVSDPGQTDIPNFYTSYKFSFQTRVILIFSARPRIELWKIGCIFPRNTTHIIIRSY